METDAVFDGLEAESVRARSVGRKRNKMFAFVDEFKQGGKSHLFEEEGATSDKGWQYQSMAEAYAERQRMAKRQKKRYIKSLKQLRLDSQ